MSYFMYMHVYIHSSYCTFIQTDIQTLDTDRHRHQAQTQTQTQTDRQTDRQNKHLCLN